MRNEREKKPFSNKQKLREFVSSILALQEMLEEFLQKERKLYRSETIIYIKKERESEKR